MEMSQSDPVTEWNSSGGQTGLEEPMWQLGLGGGSESYPERPDEADCIYYLKTGFCGYGSRCRFNHPRDRGSVAGVMRSAGGEYPERIGQPVCQYYMRTGMCKFGASCKYHHPRQGIGSSSTLALNMSGYPLRPGEKECSYYLKTGQCKFGVTCKFHHPQPTAIISPPPPPPLAQAQTPESLSMSSAIYPTSVASSQQYGVFSGNWPVARPSLLPGSYLPGTYGPVILPPGMVPFPGWNPYQTPVSPVASPNTVGGGPLYAINPHLSPPMSSYTGSYLSMPSSTGPSKKEHAFPERPGEPECQYFLKTGDCRFGSSCRYHHPQEWNVPRTNFVLSPMGLPLRPGAPLCSHYAQKGVCKFGPSCRFDHPMGTLSYSPSESSLADMPVAPYPVGSSIGTLAPSSSSSDLRVQQEEVISAATNKEDGLSMTSMPSASVGSSLSQSMPLSGSST
ncbi:zinc finger CCCH domain-containing protein 34 isoform X1 [Cynara cardunculus var. scolymus]|uniref:zinc finger CCCH domain-containing protein 34 isoform X1 n=1 Tax=Cynara cardunculus var. scolymus TaxID=59895 RepID=UPI000D62531E|nr:zinc finger CCCH domain-containing protein 34 isoform X1 [Cynara cardunculus var. scolymus]